MARELPSRATTFSLTSRSARKRGKRSSRSTTEASSGTSRRRTTSTSSADIPNRSCPSTAASAPTRSGVAIPRLRTRAPSSWTGTNSTCSSTRRYKPSGSRIANISSPRPIDTGRGCTGETPMKRRTFLGVAAAAAASKPAIRAVALDALTVFDPGPISVIAEELFPGKGAELSNLWRTRQFEYTWLRTLAGAYADFLSVTDDALVFAARALKLDLTGEHRRRLMDGWFRLRPWPDAPAALKELKAAGVRLAFLSNFTIAMLAASVRTSGLPDVFEPHLSTDLVRAFKPDPRAYRMAVDRLKLHRDEIAFAAFAGWDAAGAKAFGFPTFWINRMNLPAEELGSAPDATGADLHDVVRFVTAP